MCEDVAPDLFHIDDNGDLVAYFEAADIPADRQERARAAVRSCPIAALAVEAR
jgi:ferredoxin